MATNLGHGNAAVEQAIVEQASALPYAAPASRPRCGPGSSEALLRVLPRGLDRFFFSTSGTEANEAALRIARVLTGRPKVLANTISYHGSTDGALSVSGDLRRGAAGPSSEVGGTVFVPNCYCYRCPFGLTYPDCHVACADEVERAIEENAGVAAMILEPVVGTNGVIVPVPEYLPKLREITRRHGVLLIADEVMTGWGRTGAWFAVERFGIEPDILTTAKGITGAYAPLALTATTRSLYDHFADHYLPVGHTYEAHPLCLAPAVAAIGEYERLGLIEKSRRDGEVPPRAAPGDLGPASVGGRGARRRAVRGRRARARPGPPDAVQYGRRQALRPPSGRRGGRRPDALGGRLRLLLGEPPHRGSPTHRHPGGARPRTRRARQGPGGLRRPGPG